MDCSPAIVTLVAESAGRFAPHFHLPLQHASRRMLALMRRPYTVEDYAALVDGIRACIPHASIGSDIIVGFPGEDDDDVAEMERVLSDLPLSHLHVFPYSDRPGTDAAALANKVDGKAIRERGRRIRAIGDEMSRRFRQAQVGTSRRALTVDDGWSAVTDNYVKVRLDLQHPRNEWTVVDL
jgi:threonylcarbamoyladenosine tRNA methylthiotransferase MtaB